jgi:hypothetical protein
VRVVIRPVEENLGTVFPGHDPKQTAHRAPPMIPLLQWPTLNRNPWKGG